MNIENYYKEIVDNKKFIFIRDFISLKKRIILCNFDYRDVRITNKIFSNHLPIVDGNYEFKLIYINKNLSSNCILDLFKKDENQGWEPAKYYHIIAFAEEFPNQQKKFPIAALGSICKFNEDYHVLVLSSYGIKRSIFFKSFLNEWKMGSCFLFVRKVFLSKR